MALSPERVRSTVRFLEAYANTALSELDSALGNTDEEVGTDRRSSLAEDPAFSIAADAATALREAGQWMLYLDSTRAQYFLARSGHLFHDIGQAFGTYLVVVSGEWNHDPPYQVFSQALEAVSRRSAGAEDDEVVWPSLRHPQQQAYLLLAGGGSAAISREFGVSLTQIMETSIHREGVTPVGALGTPIRQLWNVARHLVRAGPGALPAIARHLAGMCQRYAETMELAQVNSYLWRHGAAPVDVGDIDIAGIATLTARRFGGEPLLQALEQTGLSSERSPIALAPVEAGLALADPRETAAP